MTSKQPHTLWNPMKRGTLIVSDPRCGTHFLQAVVKDAIADHVTCQTNGEIDLDFATAPFGQLRSRLDDLGRRSSYQIAVVNSVMAKTEILAHPDVVKNWHVIRLTRRDKVGWMRSWCLFFLHEKGEGREGSNFIAPDQKFMHHDTGQEVYEKMLEESGPICLNSSHIKDISCHLSLHVLCELIPADLQVDYDELPSMQSEHTWWKGNHYPDMPMEALFTNYEHICNVLKIWTDVSRSGRLGPII